MNQARVSSMTSRFGSNIPSLWEDMQPKAYIFFSMKLVTAAGNASFAAYTLSTCWSEPLETTFDVVVLFIAAIEAFIIIGSLVRAFTDIGTIWLMKDAILVTSLLRDNLTVAGGFSALMFLPVPSRMADWFARRRALLSFYVIDIPAVHGLSIFNCSWVPKVQERHQQRDGCMRIFTLVELLVLPLIVLTMQVVVPFCLLVLPFVSPLAFMVKMASLPDIKSFETWDLKRWFRFAGVINQTSHIYDMNAISQHAMFALFCETLSKSACDSDDDGSYECEYDEFQPYVVDWCITKAAVSCIGKWKAVIYLCTMDQTVLRKLLSSASFSS